MERAGVRAVAARSALDEASQRRLRRAGAGVRRGRHRSRSWACSAQLFPDAQFVITGVLGPGSNAHGPNEFLHLPTARKLTGVLARVLADHARR